ncbi:MAG: hypothetical protein NT179_08880 [Nitrospirae bacterium]|nr:hypothetical protein [Nitrospirota bacterium]
MSYKYTTIDVIVGVGMCAIVFGALLFFVAATGTFQVAPISYTPIEQSTEMLAGMAMLQPALGQAIVERELLERRTSQGMAGAIALWNKATLAQQNLESLPGGPFGAVRRDAITVPDDHAARIQTVMGREIVNFTKRGIQSGLLSADRYRSRYNSLMIHRSDARAQRRDIEFASTWQATLGRGIVEAAQNYRRLSASIQEQLGSAILQMTHLQATREESRAANQYQLASLITAAVRTGALADRIELLAAAEPKAKPAVVASQDTASLPQVPMGVLIAAALGLAAVFFGGLTMAGSLRERKAMAEMNRNNARWVYRTAA